MTAYGIVGSVRIDMVYWFYFSWFVLMFLVCRILLSCGEKFWCILGETWIVSQSSSRISVRRTWQLSSMSKHFLCIVVSWVCLLLCAHVVRRWLSPWFHFNAYYFISRIFADSWIAAMLVHRWIVCSDKGTDIDISVDLFVFCMYVSSLLYIVRWLKNLTWTRSD